MNKKETIKVLDRIASDLIALLCTGQNEIANRGIVVDSINRLNEVRSYVNEDTEDDSEDAALEEFKHQMAMARDEERMYGNPAEDWDLMQHRPSVIINDEGEPIGIG